jgi:EAL domain-containing protein (putative c-di-GMP-specific phosphodiesterase class I)
VELEGGKVVGYEALTRFASEQDPAQAFASAARVGLGVELELATLGGALQAAAALPPDAYLSLNASPAFISSGKLADIVAGQSRRIVLEITEHVAIADYPAIRRSIELLGPNIRLAVDDAGAGFASFRHILELAPDFVKLDIGLVRGIDADPARQALAAGMVFFAAERKLLLIAEGIETRAELQTLRHLGIQLGQGYLLGRPKPLARPRRRRKPD